MSNWPDEDCKEFFFLSGEEIIPSSSQQEERKEVSSGGAAQGQTPGRPVEIENALEKSSDSFSTVVAPAFFGTNYLTLEGATQNAALLAFDRAAGIDGLLVYGGGLLFGVAARVQYIDEGSRTWDTWTIRAQTHGGSNSTESAKRIAEQLIIESQEQAPLFLRAAIYVHAYVSKQSGRLLAAAAINADTLRKMLREGNYKTRKNGADGSLFLIIPWTEAPSDKTIILRAGESVENENSLVNRLALLK
jgi:hypothetical protein